MNAARATAVTPLSAPSLPTQTLFLEFKNLSDDQQSATIYITDDPSKNICQVAVWSEETITFATTSEFRFTFRDIIGDLAIERGLQISPPSGPEWKIEFRTGQIRYWSLTPLQPVDLEPGERLLFRIENLTLGPETSEDTKEFKFEWYISGKREFDQGIPVMRSKPGGGFTHMRALTFGCAPVADDWNVKQNAGKLLIPFKQMDEVFINYDDRIILESPIGFFIANADLDQPIPKDEAKSFSFSISFRTGDGPQALVAHDTEEQRSLSALDLRFAGSSAEARWEIRKDQSSGMVSWDVTPRGPNIFEEGEVVSFVLENVRANQDLGMSALEISYYNFPGYKNGTVPIWILKVFPPPTILELSCSAQGLFMTPREIEVSWKTFASADLSINIYGLDGQMHSIPISNPQDSYKLPPLDYSCEVRIVTFSIVEAGIFSQEQFVASVGYLSTWGIPKDIDWSLRGNTISGDLTYPHYFFYLVQDGLTIGSSVNRPRFPVQLSHISDERQDIILVECTLLGTTCYAHYRLSKIYYSPKEYDLEVIDPSWAGLDPVGQLLFDGSCQSSEHGPPQFLQNILGRVFRFRFPLLRP